MVMRVHLNVAFVRTLRFLLLRTETEIQNTFTRNSRRRLFRYTKAREENEKLTNKFCDKIKNLLM
jgi:hypothetical protein